MNILHFHIPTIVSNSNLPRKCKQSAIRELGAIKFLSTEKFNGTGSAAWPLAWAVDACRMQCSTGLTRQVRRVTMVIILNSTQLNKHLDISTSTGLHDKIQQTHTHFLQATSITTRGSTQQESERDDKRYPLPVSVQLQTCIITYHS